MSEPAVQGIIVVGGSAGALDALSTIVLELPGDLPAAVAVVVHHYDRVPSVFAKLLGRGSRLQTEVVGAATPLRAGRIYIPPTDRHIVVEPGLIRSTRTAKENRTRPALDPLFRTAARAYGRAVVGVVLSGQLDDGTAGLMAVKRAGGLTIVQDPDEAPCPGMPSSALSLVEVDHRVRAREIAPLLVAATAGTIRPNGDPTATRPPPGAGALTELSCPLCHGVMRETDDGHVVTYACHTGHRFGIESLLEGQEEDVELALWSAMRALEEKALLLQRIGSGAGVRGFSQAAERYEEERRRIEHHVHTLRRLLESG